MAESARRERSWAGEQLAAARSWLLDHDPTFWAAMAPLLVVSAVLFTRHPQTNFIFDEQEALLANPYVNGTSLAWWQVVERDFWGLPPTRSIGSYRPLPDLVWRLVAAASRGAFWVWNAVTRSHEGFALQPWVFHWVNVVLHAVVGAQVVLWVHEVTRRRGLAWLAGFLFVGSAILTEAVSGVVGLADVLGGLGVVLAMRAALLPGLGKMCAGVLGGAAVALFSKESGLVVVPLAGLAAILLAPVITPARPRAWLRAALATASAAAAFVAYVELRKRWFPAPLAHELVDPLPDGAGLARKAARAFLVWYHQPSLPHDPLNNPLVRADLPHRIGGALRVWWRGLVQVLLPVHLSGDYSFPQEPIPERPWFLESVLGLLALVLMPLAALVLALRARLSIARERLAHAGDEAWRPRAEPLLAALCLLWIPITYLPVSNIPVLLPTVRAERFWYFPALATSVLLAMAFAWLHARTRHLARGAVAPVLFAAFYGYQCERARDHALDYRDDLAFWDATRHAVPRSAKAHLNYSVMWGARGRLDIREQSNRVALDLAPDWPMANVYLGDTLCREHRADEAWPYFQRGFELAPDDPNLIALGLQCLWDEGKVKEHEQELEAMGDRHRGAWLDFLAKDLVYNGEAHGGVDPKYRPRAYDEGPKE